MSDNISQDINLEGEGNIVVGKGNVIIHPLPPAEARLRRDLGTLVNNVENTWIKGVLEKSVHEAALLELGIEMRDEAVDNPWRMIIEGTDQGRETLPRGIKVKQIFYEANRLLLILGEPGSGKTTTLSQLARDLIAEVDEAFTQPVPVIINLSTWTNKQQPLDEWLVLELNSKYCVPKKDGQRWLKQRRILPLLDGLDEVRVENRAACVDKINQLVGNYGLQGMVVCSRIEDYADLDVRLAFYRAIYIQPLTPEQVDEYLDQAGDKLASLRATLRDDQALRSMAQSPLILNIMSLAYQNTSAEALSDPSLNTDRARRKHLFDTYITRMFNRKVSTRFYNDESTKQWLSWLARSMQQHNQEVFLIEGLQPSWLSIRPWQWFYVLSSRLIAGLIAALLITYCLLIAALLIPYSYWPTRLSITGLAIGIADLLRFEWIRKRRGKRKPPTFLWLVINIAVVWLIVGLLDWPAIVINQGLFFGALNDTLGWGLIVGLIFGTRGSQRTLENDIEAVETLRWSWRKAIGGAMMVWLITILALTLSHVLFDTGIDLSYLIGAGILFASIGAMLYGLKREIIETKSVPNQGIQLSIRNAIFGGLLFGLSVGLIFVSAMGLIYGLNDQLISALLFIVLIFGLSGALWYGGLDVIQHYTLRLILLIQVHTPANYARFLDYAVDRIFLQRVGGGYRFIHRLLLEHFAEMGETQRN